MPGGRRKRVDRDLVQAAQRGDREAFAILARTHGDRLYAIAQRILRDAGLAEDALQQTLVNAWRELPNLRDPDRFVAWATRLLVHECYAESRRRSRHAASIRVLPVDGLAASDGIAGLVDRDQLERGFRRLPEDQRAVLVLHHYIGLEPTEIAATLGIPAGTVRSRLHYAHRAMRAALEADDRANAAGEAGG
jgi:RNA polymerase sigma-70 factor (ECF subfamily)